MKLAATWPLVLLSSLVLGSGCRRAEGSCANCGTVVIAAVREPSTLLPPLVFETVGRDIGDQVFERLANLAPGASPIDLRAYRPGLADRWTRVDSLTWRFQLRPGARWHDGHPVTAADVVFSFAAFSDSTLGSAARSYLAGKIRATAEDSMTVLVRFTQPSPEELYDATYHVRIIPRHIWAGIPISAWEQDTALAHLVGSGPYRVQEWRRGQFLALSLDTTGLSGKRLPAVRRAVWRFVADPDAALNLVLSHEADVLETAGSPERVQRAKVDPSYQLVNYPAAAYGFLAFRVADATGHPHPVLANRELRRALTQAIDRGTLARAVFGPDVKVPPGPMSQVLWIWDNHIRVIQFDSAAARRRLQQLRVTPASRPIDILVPASSSTRRQLALAIQEAWRKLNVPATVTVVDFPVFQERLAKGRFDSYIGAYLDEPSPRGLVDQWTRAGWEALNYGHYANPVFDSLLATASREADPGRARARWREAMDTLNSDAPALFLYAPANTAVIHRRLGNVTLDPYSWISGLPGWKVEAERAMASK